MRSFEYVMAYLLVVGAVIYIMIMGNTRYHRDGVVGRMNMWLHMAPRYIVVGVVGALCCSKKRGAEVADKVEYHLFEVRHPLMKWAYMGLIGTAVVFYFWGVFPLFMRSGVADFHYVTAPSSVVVAGVSFIVACRSDPGTVTEANHLVQTYKYDKKLFFPDQKCVTCQTIKPARSKHCRLCNRCVMKFDHHCGWLDNDVGEANYKWFLLFLTTHLFLCGYGTWTCWHLLSYICRKAKLWEATFVSSKGEKFQATPWTVIQYLGQEYTCACGEFLFMGCVVVMMTCFLAYHLYLSACNFTTNETFKVSDLQDLNHDYSERKEALQKYITLYPDQPRPTLPPAPPSPVNSSLSKWPYNNGVLQNLKEIVIPPTVPKKRVGGKKKKA